MNNLYLKMLMELGVITAFSYNSKGAGSVPILLIIVQRGFCHSDEERQRMLIKICIIMQLLKYSTSEPCFKPN